jgi:hypothetical protein
MIFCLGQTLSQEQARDKCIYHDDDLRQRDDCSQDEMQQSRSRVSTDDITSRNYATRQNQSPVSQLEDDPKWPGQG